MPSYREEETDGIRIHWCSHCIRLDIQQVLCDWRLQRDNKPMMSRRGSRWQAAEAAAETSHLEPLIGGRDSQLGMMWVFWNLKYSTRWHISSSEAVTPDPPQGASNCLQCLWLVGTTHANPAISILYLEGPFTSPFPSQADKKGGENIKEQERQLRMCCERQGRKMTKVTWQGWERELHLTRPNYAIKFEFNPENYFLNLLIQF